MMNQHDIFKKVGQILHELTDQYQYLETHPDEWNGFELDLFQANATFLAEHVQVFRKINRMNNPLLPAEHSGMHSEAADTATVEIQPVIPVLEKEIFKPDNEPSKFEFILNDKPSADLFDFEEKSVGEIFDRPLSPEEEQIIAQKQKLREKDSLLVQPVAEEDDEIGPEPFLVTGVPAESPEPAVQTPAAALPEAVAAHTEPDPVIPASVVTEREKRVTPVSFQRPGTEQPDLTAKLPEEDKMEPELPKMTLNDLLSSQNSRNTTGEKKKTVIHDLKQAISINDKMRYIKDLFNGYNLAYAEAIDLLNKMPDLESAHEFLQRNYALKHNWENKQDTADQFYELLQQRFNHS